MFNQKWLCRYPRPREFLFDNGYEFKKNHSFVKGLHYNFHIYLFEEPTD